MHWNVSTSVPPSGPPGVPTEIVEANWRAQAASASCRPGPHTLTPSTGSHAQCWAMASRMHWSYADPPPDPPMPTCASMSSPCFLWIWVTATTTPSTAPATKSRRTRRGILARIRDETEITLASSVRENKLAKHRRGNLHHVSQTFKKSESISPQSVFTVCGDSRYSCVLFAHMPSVEGTISL